MKNSCRVAILIVLGMGTLSANAADPMHLADLAKKQSIELPTREKLAGARAELRKSLGVLNAMLRRSGKRRESGWKEYLEWDLLKSAAREPVEGEATVSNDELHRLVKLFIAEHNGLEMLQFTSVRDSLRRLSLLQQIATDDKTQALHKKILTQLQKDLEAVKTDRSRVAAIGRYAGWLRERDQAPELVDAIAETYRHPNAHFHISGDLVEKAANLEIDDEQSISDVILGTTIRGKATTTGRVQMRFVPSDEKAKFELLLSGVIKSKNTGWNRGVTVYTRGTTTVNATKQIIFDENGIGVKPSVTRCWTNSSITGIYAKSKLIRKIAWRKAGKDKGKAERIASRHAESRVSSQLDAQAAEFISQLNDAYVEGYRNQLIRKGDLPPRLRAVTTKGSLDMWLQHVGRLQVGAPTAPPKPKADSAAAVALHESLVGNMTEPFWGGYTLTDKRLVELLEEFDAEVPEALRVGRDRWAITFASSQPIQLSFSDNSLTVALNLRRIISGRRRISSNLRIAAKYKIKHEKGHVEFLRDGDVTANYPGLTKLTTGEVAASRLLRSKFRALFKEKIAREGIELPPRLNDAGSLKLSQIKSNDGWLTIAWHLVKPASPVASKSPVATK